MEFAQERAEEQLAKREDQPHFLNIRRSGINPTASRNPLERDLEEMIQKW